MDHCWRFGDFIARRSQHIYLPPRLSGIGNKHSYKETKKKQMKKKTKLAKWMGPLRNHPSTFPIL